MLPKDALNGCSNNKENETNFTLQYNLLCGELTVT